MGTKLFAKSTDDDEKESSTTDEVMSEKSFGHYVEKERERLTKVRDELLAKRAEIDARIEMIDRELNAINAYEAAKNGRTTRNNKSGIRRSGRRNELLEAIKKHPNGISRDELINNLGAKDKKEKMAISNALSALKRSKKISKDDKGKYHVVMASDSIEKV